MDRNKLLEDFSAVCFRLADDLPSHASRISDDAEMMTPLYNEASITDMNEWWKWNDHFTRWVSYLQGIEANVPGGRDANIQSGIDEIAKSPTLLMQFNALDPLQQIRHLPHEAGYAYVLKRTPGYKALTSMCDRMPNVVVWPLVTIDETSTSLKKAFYLNNAIVSTDGKPLRPKLRMLVKG